MKTNPNGGNSVGEQRSMWIDVHNIYCKYLLTEFITRYNFNGIFKILPLLEKNEYNLILAWETNKQKNINKTVYKNSSLSKNSHP